MNLVSSMNSMFGIHEQALRIRGERATVLANNIANADTPGFKARDVDFSSVLNAAKESQVRMTSTNKGHISLNPSSFSESELLFRTPYQVSLDGNTVDGHIEQQEFAKNALAFQASFTFLNGKVKGLMTAIRGE